MEESLLALLQGEASITAMVPAGSMTWVEIGQGVGAPYVVLHVVSDDDGLHMQGANKLPAYRVQVDCYATTHIEAKSASRVIQQFLHGYRADGFRLITHAGTRDHGRELDTNTADRLFRVGMDFLVNWRMST